MTDDPCPYCGGRPHQNRGIECRAYTVTCNKCHRLGHFQKVCRSKKKQPTTAAIATKPEESPTKEDSEEEDTEGTEAPLYLFGIMAASEGTNGIVPLESTLVETEDGLPINSASTEDHEAPSNHGKE